MIKVSIPYKSHNNKSLWDYLTQLSNQLNNINLAYSLYSPEADVDNAAYLVFDKGLLSMFVGLSQQVDNQDEYLSYCDAWATFQGTEYSEFEGCHIFSFDIKKYNSVLSFSEDYKARDKINFYIDENANKLVYSVAGTDYVDLSPIVVSSELADIIMDSYNEYRLKRERKTDDTDKHMRFMSVSSVDKNSFLLPFMAYKDFLNFATYSSDNKTHILTDAETGISTFVNSLYKGNDCKFYLSTLLRPDKFNIDKTNIAVPVGLWQILVVIQHYKAWHMLQCYTDNTADLVFNQVNPKDSTVMHIFHNHYRNTELTVPNLDDFKLVGRIHSNELFKLNKLYSNANRTCYFDFSTQTFTGNNYVFNDERLDIKTIDLSDKVDAELPLKITFTEIKHYTGSDLSQKNFTLRVYTDGIRVMLERWTEDNTKLECRVVFNHAMSKKNQCLNTV